MALILSDLGADEFLKIILNNDRAAGGNNLTLKLFVNDVTPTQTSTAATFTEATGGGYLPMVLTMGSWTITTANDPSDAVYAERVFTFSGTLTTNPTIYGYYVVDADNVLLWAERLTASFTPANNGDHLDITPKIQISSGTPA